MDPCVLIFSFFTVSLHLFFLFSSFYSFDKFSISSFNWIQPSFVTSTKPNPKISHFQKTQRFLSILQTNWFRFFQLSASMASASPLLYLLDGCWESIFKLLIDTNDNDFKDYNHVLKSLSVISKKFLSITRGLRFSLTISKKASLSFFSCDFQRFTNLTSLDFTLFNDCLNTVLCNSLVFR